MRKLYLLLCLPFLSLYAEWSFDVGGGGWFANPGGSLTYTLPAPNNSSPVNLDQLGFSQSTAPYAYIDIRHPLPILPYIRFETLFLKYTGNIQNSGIIWDDANNPLPNAGPTTYTMNQQDVTLYYRVFSAFDIDLDIGIDARFTNTKLEINEGNSTVDPDEAQTCYPGFNASVNAVFPMVYARASFQKILNTGLGVVAKGRYISFVHTTSYDYEAKVNYTFDVSTIVDVGVEAGYRYLLIDLAEGNNAITQNSTFSGPFVGAFIDF